MTNAKPILAVDDEHHIAIHCQPPAERSLTLDPHRLRAPATNPEGY